MTKNERFHALKALKRNIASSTYFLSDAQRIAVKLEESTPPQFTSQECATVLAALRYWQATVEDPKRYMPDHFADCEPLTDDAIDDLCERINCQFTADEVEVTQ